MPATGRDIVAELGCRTFINAAGTYTRLTASRMPDEVVEAIRIAATKFCDLNELQTQVGESIASRLRCEAAMVSAGCASALTLATAACVAGDDPENIKRLPDTEGMKGEVIIQKGHRLGYDHAIRNVGVTLVEVETREEMEKAVNDETAMMAFINTKAPDGQVQHEEFVEVARAKGVPTLIDAAADIPPVENLWRFTEMGFDLVAFSGGKGLRGPQSAGLLLGRGDLIAAARLNNSPNSDTVCRTNKVNKEELVGMLAALELYLDQDHKAVWADWEGRCDRIAAAVADVEGVSTETFVPEIANAAPHLRISWDAGARGLTPAQASDAMRDGEPSIEVRPGAKEALEIAVWMLNPGEDEVVGARVREVLTA